MKYGIFALGLVALAGTANAAFFVEAEANNTPGTANFVGVYAPPGDAFLVDGTLPVGDVDYFRFSVTGAAEIKAAVYGRPDSTAGDSFMYLLAADGTTILESDDDDNIGFFSSLEKNVAAGTYFLKVDRFAGTPAFEYKLVVGINVVPAPASLGLLGLGGMVASRRRRA
ncbi:MAG: PPC domain-containing protein [Phycisphaerae bacterium]|nr:PPC domain-containing protein [Phycisphaerae bacterium]